MTDSTRAESLGRIRGLYGIADASVGRGDPVRLGRQMLEGGCRLLQLRCKNWSHLEILAAARELVQASREVGATLILNDWPSIAVEAGADGVHIGQTDGDPREARAQIGPTRILGLSTNQLHEVAAAGLVADYVAFGPVFDTAHVSRPKATQGLIHLAEARRRLQSDVPLVAIGGITAGRVAEVRECGAVAWAVIGAIAQADDPIQATRTLLA